MIANKSTQVKEVLQALVQKALRPPRKMAVKKSYFFNKLVKRMEQGIQIKGLKKPTKNQKKKNFIDKYLPNLPQNYRNDFYMQKC